MLVARSVRAVVRDRDWGTVPVAVTAVAHEHGAVVLALRYDGLGIAADATLRIEARGAALSVSLALTADGPIATNRTGLVLLQMNSRVRPATWPLVALGFAIPLVLVMLLIH